MIVYRCTQRLARSLRVSLADGAFPSTGLLGDWYSKALNMGRSRNVLCLSERTLLPVIIPARKSEFPARFSEYLEGVLLELGIPPHLVERETSAAAEPVFARTESRSLVGTLNDFAFGAAVHLEAGESWLNTSLLLAETPSKAIGYSFPIEATRNLFGSDGPLHSPRRPTKPCS